MRALHIPRSQAPQPRWTVAPDGHTPQIMAAPPAITVSASPTLERAWFAGSGNSSYPLASHAQGGHFTFCRGVPDTAGPTLGFRPAATVSTLADGTRAPSGMQFCFYHEGENLELHFQNNERGYLLKVDGEYVSLAPTQNSAQTYTLLSFGARKLRRFDLITYNAAFAGVWTDPRDTLYAAPVRGPRAICVGDSFTEAQAGGWTNWFAEAMGWDDVWTSGVGGTGYVDDGSGVTKSWQDRIHDDVIAYSPDVVFLHGSVNDLSSAPATVYNAVHATISAIRNALPRCVIAGGMNTGAGIETWTASQLDVQDQAKAAFVAAGGAWMSTVELPHSFTGTPIGVSAELMDPVAAGRAGNGGTPSVIAGQSGFRVNTSSATADTNLRIGSTVEIGTGATRERVVITAVGLSGGRFIYGFDGVLQHSHAAGEPVREVPPSYLTGQGSAFAPTDWGNTTNYVGMDGFHPSPEGNIALGLLNASLLKRHLRTIGIV